MFCYITKQWYFYESFIYKSFCSKVKEKIKQLIAEHLIRKAQLKTTLYNLNVIGAIDDNILNKILDQIKEIDESIQKLKEILKLL